MINNDGKLSLKQLVGKLKKLYQSTFTTEKYTCAMRSLLSRISFGTKTRSCRFYSSLVIVLTNSGPFALEIKRIMHFSDFITDSGTCHSSLFSSNIIATIVAKFSADKFSGDESNSKNCYSSCWTACWTSFLS